MQDLVALLAKIWSAIKDQMPAFLLAIFEYEEGQIDEEKKKEDQVSLQLKEMKNKELVDEKYSGESDLDIVNQSISDGGGTASGTGPGNGGDSG